MKNIKLKLEFDIRGARCTQILTYRRKQSLTPAQTRVQMPEDENVNVAEGENPAEAVVQATETETNVPEAPQDQVQERKKSVEYNWAEARRKMEILDAQNREMRQKLDQIQQAQQPSEDDEIERMGAEELMTKAQAQKLAEKTARTVADQMIRQRDAETSRERLMMKFPDIGDVVTPENLEQLREQEPELYRSLEYIPDPYEAGAAAYKLLKKVNNVAKNNLEKKQAEKNSQKPQSVNAVTNRSAIGNAHLFENGLTPELKKQLWSEMQEARKRA